jgi:putative transferase (TIGR04331 family)
VDVVYNRVKTISQCLESYNVSGTTVLDSSNYSLATSDSLSAIWSFSDDRWNNALFAHIFNLIKFPDFQIETICDIDRASCFSYIKSDMGRMGSGHIFKKAIKFFGHALSCVFVSDKEGFIMNSYLPKKEEIKLYLMLGQIPRVWGREVYIVNQKASPTIREGLSRNLGSQGGDEVEFVIKKLLFELLPVCFLEGFSELLRTVEEKPWPSNPKFIFTSNNYDTDEVFKLWAAHKTLGGTQYVIGQHGNNAGAHKYLGDTYEMEIADKYLTWGWKRPEEKFIPTFIFKVIRGSNNTYHHKGGLLLILVHQPHRVTLWDEIGEYSNYLGIQQAFIGQLSNNIKRALTVRLHGAHSCFNWYEKESFNDFDSRINIEQGKVPIERLIEKSRLVVHGYDSTGMLETLFLNRPTLAFWEGGLDHLTDEAKSYYQPLVDEGVIHFTPESIAMKVGEIWDDVETWWQSSKVQEVRLKFCNQYARGSEKPVYTLKEILLNNA